MRAARADDPARLRDLGRPVPVVERHQEAVWSGLDRRCADAALHRDPNVSQPLREDLLGTPLRQGALEFPAAAGAGEVKLADYPQVGVEQPSEPQMLRGGEDLVSDARPAEEFERSWLDRGRAGLVVGQWLALDHPRADPMARQLQRREQTRGSSADNEHVDRHRPIVSKLIATRKRASRPGVARLVAMARVIQLGELETIQVAGVNWRPVRRTLGITGFGVNAYTADRGECLIEEHDESASGAGRHEELYVILSGHATFNVDATEIDAHP